MSYESDKRVVLTLDAGGTNFVFSALQGYQEIVEPIRKAAVPDNIEKCLNVIEEGFLEVCKHIEEAPVAISFAFPGPADYENGVIGDLPNFKAFRGGVPMGPWLEQRFKIPVYINNDGNLFAYGEAIGGILPEINAELKAAGQHRRYKHLLGITLGTGFGGGVVVDGNLLTGDNGCGGDVWLMRNRKYPNLIVEESVSIRAVKRVYGEKSGVSDNTLTPKDICEIADGTKVGNQQAAQDSFFELGELCGEAIATALDIVDGIVVIGGGLTGASNYIMPGVMKALRGNVSTFAGDSFPILQSDVYNWDDTNERQSFLNISVEQVSVPGTTLSVPYIRKKTLCVATSKNGASNSIMRGAYAFALHQLDKKQF